MYVYMYVIDYSKRPKIYRHKHEGKAPRASCLYILLLYVYVFYITTTPYQIYLRGYAIKHGSYSMTVDALVTLTTEYIL